MQTTKMLLSLLSISLCLSMGFSQASAQDAGNRQKWKLESPFKRKNKKQYATPVALTDRQNQRNWLNNPLKNSRNNGTQTNWFKEWDQRHREFWKSTGENVNNFVMNRRKKNRGNLPKLFKSAQVAKV